MKIQNQRGRNLWGLKIPNHLDQNPNNQGQNPNHQDQNPKIHTKILLDLVLLQRKVMKKIYLKVLKNFLYRQFLLTGSTIRNWHKVKTWFDQMFWQIYQKMMLSGFLSSGNLCLINHLKVFWPHAVLTNSDTKGAKIQHEISWSCQKNIFLKTSR